MKRSLASLAVVVLVLGVAVTGCSNSSSSVNGPDTTPPLAPVMLGGSSTDQAVNVWWQPNTEADLDGYNVYVTQGGVTTKANQQPMHYSYWSMVPTTDSKVNVYVTASDVSGNESSPSSAITLSLQRQGGKHIPIEGVNEKDSPEVR